MTRNSINTRNTIKVIYQNIIHLLLIGLVIVKRKYVIIIKIMVSAPLIVRWLAVRCYFGRLLNRSVVILVLPATRAG